MTGLWQRCLEQLKGQVTSQQFNTWIRPLQTREQGDVLYLFAPNYFVQKRVSDEFLQQIETLIKQLSEGAVTQIKLTIGSITLTDANLGAMQSSMSALLGQTESSASTTTTSKPPFTSNLNKTFTFEAFVKGRSNELAEAAARQVAENTGSEYNPLFIYGDVGLGKTHLMHAIGNEIIRKRPDAKVLYLHSERFVTEMVKALQTNTIDAFKQRYRTVDAVLMDDVQFFANKERSQEELFHLINSMMEEKQQIVMTSDRFPKELDGVEERLKSRFSWGLAVGVEPPEIETRVAILLNKAAQSQVDLPQDVAFFIAKRLRSNVRELEGALKRVIANAHFTGRPITIDFVQDALRDLLSVQAKLVTIENIQREVARYYGLKVKDMLSSSRKRQIARPRQLAMALAKELTTRSLPEIGADFGGRDHTTVLHACRKVKELAEMEAAFKEDMENLMKLLTA